ncbi:putative membrane protein [Variovorax sp. TBS-050B]|uniref:hypothetical protein n=1 Tax=Variovorax sp. TBS-050B TaxID=2940551 RepID=UPI0024732460|nr:hypothetical protein [Variovorax sp. TBS-050B]MDH6592061.1 putative membrane protein [Variovorax sp. TBS-050B]
MTIGSKIKQLQQMDARRPDFPGEHLAVLGAGLLLLLTAGRSRSLPRRVLAGAAGGALVGRAASGTGGLARVARMLQGGMPVRMR